MVELGRGIAAVLRGGTRVAVVAIGAGMVLALVTGDPAPGPTSLLELAARGGADALIAAGVLVLTLTPPATLVVAIVALRRSGEPSRAVTAALVLALLAGSLVLAALIGTAS